MKRIKVRSRLYGNHVVFIDNDDLDRLKYKSIRIAKGKYTFYAYINGRLLHRILMNCPLDKQVDHIDGNGLNCVKSNLRICTHYENARNVRIHKNNSSGFKGVYFQNGRYRVQLMANHKFYYGGRFDSKIEAARAYNELAIEHHGTFAKLNLFTTHQEKELSTIKKRRIELVITNTSGYRGVSICESRGKANPYVAQITVNNKNKYLGGFKSPLEAAIVYNRAAKKYHGKFARLNKIPS